MELLRFCRFSSAGGFAVFHKVTGILVSALATQAEGERIGSEGWGVVILTARMGGFGRNSPEVTGL